MCLIITKDILGYTILWIIAIATMLMGSGVTKPGPRPWY